MLIFRTTGKMTSLNFSLKDGPRQCAVVGGFSTYQARGAVADVAKVLGVSDFQIRRFTERIPLYPRRGLHENLGELPECRDLPIHEEPYKTALAMAEFLDGFPRYPKMHPCGVVSRARPFTNSLPLSWPIRDTEPRILTWMRSRRLALLKWTFWPRAGWR